MNRVPTLIPWIGGKGRLAAEILPLFPEHTCYVEVFAGAAALYFNKSPAKVEVLNDVNGELVNLYRVVKNHLEEFVRQFRWALISREIWKWLQATPVETLTDVQRAARFYYLQKYGFGGMAKSFGTSAVTKPRMNLLRIEEDLSEIHIRLAHTTIERLDWKECVARYDRPSTFFYLDPPYWGTEGYGVPFLLEEYDAMAEVLRSMKGKALVSVNDIPEMRKAFEGLQVKRLRVLQSISRLERSHRAELLISN